jgi:hypothetical protein
MHQLRLRLIGNVDDSDGILPIRAVAAALRLKKGFSIEADEEEGG